MKHNCRQYTFKVTRTNGSVKQRILAGNDADAWVQLMNIAAAWRGVTKVELKGSKEVTLTVKERKTE